MRELKRQMCLLLAFLMLTSSVKPFSLQHTAGAELLEYTQEQLSASPAPEDAEAELSLSPASDDALPSE